MANENSLIKFTFCNHYYPNSQVIWDQQDKILFTRLFNDRWLGQAACLKAPNITQICFDLSASSEVKYVEYVGFEFERTDSMVAPLPTHQGNLIALNPPPRIDYDYSESSTEEIPANMPHEISNRLELKRNQDHSLLRIGIGRQISTAVVAPSPHLMYVLSGETLQEIWIVNPFK